jgi:hypothetical protein
MSILLALCEIHFRDFGDNPVRLSSKILKKHRISRYRKYRALELLERAGLISSRTSSSGPRLSRSMLPNKRIHPSPTLASFCDLSVRLAGSFDRAASACKIPLPKYSLLYEVASSCFLSSIDLYSASLIFFRGGEQGVIEGLRFSPRPPILFQGLIFPMELQPKSGRSSYLRG